MRTDHSRVPRGALHGQSASVCHCWAPPGPPKGGCPHSPAPHWVSSGAHRISWVPSAPRGSRAPNRAGAAQSRPAVLSRHPSRQPTQSRALGAPPPPSPRFSAPRPRVTAKQLLRPTTQLQRQPPPFPRGSNSHRTRQANQPGLPSLLPGPTCRGGLPLPAARRGSPALLCSTPAQGTPPEPHGSLSAQRPPHAQPQPRGRIDCKGWNSEPR